MEKAPHRDVVMSRQGSRPSGNRPGRLSISVCFFSAIILPASCGSGTVSKAVCWRFDSSRRCVRLKFDNCTVEQIQAVVVNSADMPVFQTGEVGSMPTGRSSPLKLNGKSTRLVSGRYRVRGPREARGVASSKVEQLTGQRLRSPRVRGHGSASSSFLTNRFGVRVPGDPTHSGGLAEPGKASVSKTVVGARASRRFESCILRVTRQVASSNGQEQPTLTRRVRGSSPRRPTTILLWCNGNSTRLLTGGSRFESWWESWCRVQAEWARFSAAQVAAGGVAGKPEYNPVRAASRRLASDHLDPRINDPPHLDTALGGRAGAQVILARSPWWVRHPRLPLWRV
jgi:hypothetical protein